METDFSWPQQKSRFPVSLYLMVPFRGLNVSPTPLLCLTIHPGGGKEARGDVRGPFLEPLGQRERRQRQRKRWKGHNKTLLSVQDVSCYVLTTL